MKKYTIVLSDDEEESKIDTNGGFAQPSSSLPRGAFSAVPPTELISCNSNVNNISQDVSFVSPCPIVGSLDVLKIENGALSRSPIPKSDDEIRYWVMTARPPCLYQPEDLITDSNNTNRLISSRVSSAPICSYEDACKTTTERRSESYNEPNVYSKALLPRAEDTSSNNGCHNVKSDIAGTSPNLEQVLLFGAYSPSKLNVSADRQLVNKLLDSPENKNSSSKISNQLTKPFGNSNFFKDSNPTLLEPLNDYDSCSSVLTINYIQYVNDKAKSNKKSKKYNMAPGKNHPLDASGIHYSPRKITQRTANNRILMFKNKPGNGLSSLKNKLSPDRYNCSPIGATSNKQSIEKPNIQRKLSKKRQLFKQSVEEMRRKNKPILDISKTSSSSIENRYSEKKSIFKKCSKVLSDADNNICYSPPRRKSKPTYSDYGSSTTSSNINIMKCTNSQNITMAYTKVETHYISSNGHSTDSTYSAVINFSSKTASFLSES